MDDCIFCRITERKIPAKIVYEDAAAVAIEDLHPQAPTHLLVMPRKHIASLTDVSPEDEILVGRLFAIAAQLARKRGLDSNGYRTVVNNGPWGGQTVFHLHVHLMGGRVFHWPPG